MSIDRAGLRQQTASTRPAARWQRESASEPITRTRSATPRIPGAAAAIASVVVPSSERISIRSFGPGASSGAPPRKAPRPRSATHSSRGPEVVDVAEVDVVHRRPVGDREGEREERDRALRVDRAVDRVDDDPQLAAAPEGRGRRAPRRRASESWPSSSRRADDRRPRPPRRSRSCRRRPRRRAARARARARVGRSARTPSRSATQVRQNASQSVTGRPDGRGARRASFGKKYVVFWGIISPRRARSKTSSMRVGRRSSAQSASPDSTRRTASTRSGVYEIPSWPSAIDELDVELARRPVHEPRRVGAHEDRGRARERLVHERRERVLDRRERVAGEIDVLATDEDPVGREDLEPWVGERDEHDQHPVGAVLRRESRTPSRSGGGRRRSAAGCRRRATRRPGRPRARGACRRPRDRARSPAS